LHRDFGRESSNKRETNISAVCALKNLSKEMFFDEMTFKRVRNSNLGAFFLSLIQHINFSTLKIISKTTNAVVQNKP